jgi:L-arabinose isomerase
MPNLADGAAAWIYDSGTHHSAYTLALIPDYIEAFAEFADLKYVATDKKTCFNNFIKELRWNDVYYLLSNGLK